MVGFLGGFGTLMAYGLVAGFGGVTGYTLGRFRSRKRKTKNPAIQEHYERMGLGRR